MSGGKVCWSSLLCEMVCCRIADESGVEIWSRSRGWVVDQKTRMKAISIFEVCCGSDDEDKVARMNL